MKAKLLPCLLITLIINTFSSTSYGTLLSNRQTIVKKYVYQKVPEAMTVSMSSTFSVFSLSKTNFYGELASATKSPEVLFSVISKSVLRIAIVTFKALCTIFIFLFVFTLDLTVCLIGFYCYRSDQKYTKEKLRFFTAIAHEIRTSLTLIDAPIMQLNKASELSDKSRYYLNVATDQTERLNVVATQLLDFEKMDKGKETLDLTTADLVALVGTRVKAFEVYADKKSVKLVFASDVNSIYAKVDVVKAEKIVDNLLSNAIKYSHQNGRVEIGLSHDKVNWRLRVKDFGIGIPEQDTDKPFKEFYRSRNAVNAKIVGSGVGLLLIREYVRMHGGEALLWNNPVHKGVTFEINIPLCPASNKKPMSLTSIIM